MQSLSLLHIKPPDCSKPMKLGIPWHVYCHPHKSVKESIRLKFRISFFNPLQYQHLQVLDCIIITDTTIVTIWVPLLDLQIVSRCTNMALMLPSLMLAQNGIRVACIYQIDTTSAAKLECLLLTSIDNQLYVSLTWYNCPPILITPLVSCWKEITNGSTFDCVVGGIFINTRWVDFDQFFYKFSRFSTLERFFWRWKASL